jgi:hypothetical protein
LPNHLRRQLPDPYQAVHETAIQAYIKTGYRSRTVSSRDSLGISTCAGRLAELTLCLAYRLEGP